MAARESPHGDTEGGRTEAGTTGDDSVFGRLGVLAVDELEDKVQCHRCGRWYRFLANHAWRRHGMPADDYRTQFGLTARHGLVSPGLAADLRRRALRSLRPYYERAADLARALTPEQRSVAARGRRLRLERRLSPRWQAARQAIARRQSETMRERYRALDAAGRAAFRARFGPPRPRTPATCVVCGARFFSASHGSRARTCGPACATLHRRRLDGTPRPATRPQVRAQIAAAARRRRAGYDVLLASLRALDAAAFQRLSDIERDVLRLYYGLDPSGARTRSLRELSAMTGLRRGQVERVLRRGLLRLLDPAVAGLAATCEVCGRPFAREAVNSPRVTCSPVCARERSRATLSASGGQARLSAAARQRGRAEGAHLRALVEQTPSAFETLPAHDQVVVRLYHGLPVAGLRVVQPWTKREIAIHLGAGTTVWRVTQALRRGVEGLLRPGAARSEEERRDARRARISAAARVRGRPGADALRALAPEAFEALAEPQRSAVRRYYGLEDGRPWTRREVAADCGRSPEWVGRAVALGVAALLAERAPGAALRRCVVCGRPFAPAPGAYRSTRQTCTDACNRELRRRRAIASRATRKGSEGARSDGLAGTAQARP